MERRLKTPLAMGAVLVLVMLLGLGHTWPPGGLDELRAAARLRLQPEQPCLAGCGVPGGASVCAPTVPGPAPAPGLDAVSALAVRHDTTPGAAFADSRGNARPCRDGPG